MTDQNMYEECDYMRVIIVLLYNSLEDNIHRNICVDKVRFKNQI